MYNYCLKIIETSFKTNYPQTINDDLVEENYFQDTTNYGSNSLTHSQNRKVKVFTGILGSDYLAR